MRDYLSVDRDVNAIRLRRSTFSGTFLLVEGSSDKIFYERFIDKTSCQIVTASGKPSSKYRAIEIIEILNKSNFQGILAIVDADFDRLKVSQYTIINLILTDTHDLETVLFNSPAFDKVISEFASEKKITDFGRDIRDAILEIGILIGHLRWLSQIDELNLNFNGIEFSYFIDQKTLIGDELKLIQVVKNKSQASYLNSEDLKRKLKEQKDASHDPWQVCCGHDLVKILSLGLRKAIGSANASDVEPSLIERSLRLAYEASYFCQTEIYSSVCMWERKNLPFRVLLHDI